MNTGETAPMAGRAQPARDEVAGDPRLTIIENNLAQTLLSRLRDRRTDVPAFSTTASELARLVLYEACRDIPLADQEGEGFDGGPIKLSQPSESIAGIAVLRAGLIFEPAFRMLLPGLPLYQLGLRRNEVTLEPITYADNLPDRPSWADRILIVDPMLATGGTATAAIEIVRRRHTGPLDILCLVAAPYGVQAVLNADPTPTTRITTLALDHHLNDQGYIIPGLGDAGDRFFGT